MSTQDPFEEELLATAISVAEFQANLTEAIETAQTQAVLVKDNRTLVAVLISYERYDELMTFMEDAQDIAAFDAALAEAEGGETYTMDQIREEFNVPRRVADDDKAGSNPDG